MCAVTHVLLLRSRPSARSAAFSIVVAGIPVVLAAALGAASAAGSRPDLVSQDESAPEESALLVRRSVAPIASDGRSPAPMGSLVTVRCGDPAVPLGRQYRLESECEPSALVPISAGLAVGGGMLVEPAWDSLSAMFREANSIGLSPKVISAYRSFETQRTTFSFWERHLGEVEAVRVSAKPGHSEHQLGTTVDISCAAAGFTLTPTFGNTAEGLWLADNAARFGFVLSYPRGREESTGYVFEPWHFRYVGTEVAGQIVSSGLTPLEFLAARFRN